MPVQSEWVSFLDPVNHKHAVGRFYLIHDQYVRYVDPTDHEDGRRFMILKQERLGRYLMSGL